MTDIALPPEASISEFRGLYDPELDFRKLASEVQAGYAARGFRKVDKDALEGIPLMIVGVTYRDGGLIREGSPVRRDYVSCETVVADRETLNLPQVQEQIGDRVLRVWPNEPVVFNDGSTGVRRALTRLFHNTGLINVGGNFAEDGPRTYDRPMDLWESGQDLAADGITATANGEKFVYMSIRGLRKSEYESPFGPAVTWYFG